MAAMTKTGAELMIRLAEQHKDEADLITSAELCIEQAREAVTAGDYGTAGRRAYRSLEYSVGILRIEKLIRDRILNRMDEAVAELAAEQQAGQEDAEAQFRRTDDDYAERIIDAENAAAEDVGA